MSLLPETWSEANGIDLFELVRGVSYDKAAIRTEAATGFVPILRANNISGGYLNQNDLVFAPDHFVTDKQMLKFGDLLIASSSGSRSVVGKAAMVTEETKHVSFGAFCTVARPREKDFSHWLRHYFSSRAYRDYVEEVALGININNLRGKDLESISIPLPPLAEQRRIVEKLDALTARTARARADLDRIPALAARYKQAVLAKAFSGELTADWRRGRTSPSPEVIGADLLKSWEATKPNTATRRGPASDPDAGRQPVNLGQLPTSWVKTNLAAITDGSRLIQYGILKPGEHVTDGVPYVKVMNIKGGVVELDKIRRTTSTIHQSYKRSSLVKGDILLTIRGTVGRLAEVPAELHGGNITQDSVRIAVLPSVSRRFVYWFLHSPCAQEYFKANQKGVAVRGINVGDVRPMELPICCIEEQEEIVFRVERAVKDIDRMVTEAAAARRLLDRLDQSVLAKAFRGELVPQDPLDEPVSVLLDRIRAERAAAPKAKRGRRKAAA